MTPKIGIIGGKGRMGKLFAAFFRKNGLEVLISDIGTELSSQELAKKSDIIVVSVPIDVTEQVIEEVLPYLNEQKAITDLTSVKSSAIKSMMKGRCEVFGMHPMFADTHPIPGQTIILCKTEKSGVHYQWMTELLEKNKTKLIKLSPSEHDELMAIVQGLPHFADIAFIDAIRKMEMPVKEVFQYCSMASQLKIQLASRLIAQDPGLYANIQIANEKNLPALRKYQKSIEDLIQIIEDKNVNEFKKYFNQNKAFLDEYADEAFKDSTYLIGKFLEKQKKSEQTALTPNKNDIALLGPKSTFTDIGASQYLKQNHLEHSKYYAKTISEVIELVEEEKVELGLVPIENKIQGTVRETIDGLFYKDIHIIDSVKIPIHHNLITLSGVQAEEVKQIFSHPQALNQCKDYLKNHFPEAELLTTSSTSGAAAKVGISSSMSIAAVASELAANEPNLQILESNIEDTKGNETEFVIIKKGSYQNVENNSHNTISLAFHFEKDQPGSLFEVLKDFAESGVNMTKIESRPTKAAFGDYIFFVNCEGSLQDTTVQKLFSRIEQKVAHFKILGVY